MSQPIHDPQIAALEAALANLVPRAEALSRDQLFFRAGQRSVRQPSWLWPGTSLFLLAMSALLGGLLLVRPVPPSVERVVYVEIPAPPHPSPARSEMPSAAVAERDPPTDAAGEDSIGSEIAALKLRNNVVRWGVDVIPAAPSPSCTGSGVTVEGLLKSLSDSPRPRKPGDAS